MDQQLPPIDSAALDRLINEDGQEPFFDLNEEGGDRR